MTTLNLALVGLGRIGRKHAQTLVFRTPGCVVSRVCALTTDEQAFARDTLGISAIDADYAQTLADPAVDAVFLTTPTACHAEQIIAALEAGKHVFCEKPIALNVADCLRVEAVARQHPSLIVCIGFVRRWDPSYTDAKRMIDAGEIGVPFMIRSQTADKDEWAEFQIAGVPQSGGIFLDMAIHDVDLVHWLSGAAVQEVYALGGAYAHAGFAEVKDADNVSALCRLSNGAMANLSVSRTAIAGHDTYTEIHGTRGVITIGQNPSNNRLILKDQHGVRNTCVQDFFERFHDAFALEAQEFVQCCLNGAPPRVSLEEARKATEVGVALGEAFRRREPVRLASE